MQDVLIVVDMQNDFCTGGALPAEDTDSLILPGQPAHPGIRRGRAAGDPEPRLAPGEVTTCSSQRTGRPLAHCTAWPGQTGAGFHPGLELPDTYLLVSKARRARCRGLLRFREHRLAPSAEQARYPKCRDLRSHHRILRTTRHSSRRLNSVSTRKFTWRRSAR